MHVRQTRLFALKEHKVYNCLAFVSAYHSYSSEGQLQESFEVDLKITGHADTFLSELTEHIGTHSDAVKSNVKNHVRNLLFDPKTMGFALEKYSPKGSYVICGPNNKRSITPGSAVNLQTNNYIYFDGKWYLKSKSGCYDLL
ncbi:MAG: hypothetical protein EOP48_04430 [Sphingobacteriales bacterium]|nr:MAG: hypothetical protein EOP48_04430 [Sphingobacteriales bacterium]